MDKPLPSTQARSRPVFAHPRIFRVGDLDREGESARKTCFRALDQELPGRGWPRAGLIELGCDHAGLGELSLLLPALAASDEGPQLWVLPDSCPWIPYAPSLVAHGLDLSQCAIVRSRGDEDSLWAAEQASRSGACARVLLWLANAHCRPINLRRLHQAGMTGNAAIFALRPLASLSTPSPAVLRIGLHAETGGALRLDLVKRRGLPDGKSITLTPRDLDCLQRQPARETSPVSVTWLSRLLASSPSTAAHAAS